MRDVALSSFMPKGRASKLKVIVDLLGRSTEDHDLVSEIDRIATVYNRHLYVLDRAPRVSVIDERLRDIRSASQSLHNLLINIDDVTADFLFSLTSDPLLVDAWRPATLPEAHDDPDYRDAFAMWVNLKGPMLEIVSSGDTAFDEAMRPLLEFGKNTPRTAGLDRALCIKSVEARLTAMIRLVDRAASDLAAAYPKDRGGATTIAKVHLGNAERYLASQCIELIDEYTEEKLMGTWDATNIAFRLIHSFRAYAAGKTGEMPDGCRKAFLEALADHREHAARLDDWAEGVRAKWGLE